MDDGKISVLKLYLQHLTLLTMKSYYIVFIMCLDLETLCYLGVTVTIQVINGSGVTDGEQFENILSLSGIEPLPFIQMPVTV